MIYIRNADLSLLPQIMNVEKDAFIPQIREKEEVFATRIEACPGLFLVFEDFGANESSEKKVMGYICAEFMNKIPETAEELQLNHLPQKSESGKILYLSSFGILKEYRGKGLGKKLWNESLNTFSKLPGIETLLLLVNSQWKNARNIYEKSGFETVHTFTGFFPMENGELSDGILMKKNI